MTAKQIHRILVQALRALPASDRKRLAQHRRRRTPVLCDAVVYLDATGHG